MFIICFLAALLGGGLAAFTALDTSDCGPPGTLSDHACDAGTQATEDASNTVAIASLVLMIGGLGFQLGRPAAPAAPMGPDGPPMPFPPPAGPPRPLPPSPPHGPAQG